jgi:hypothetical protein
MTALPRSARNWRSPSPPTGAPAANGAGPRARRCARAPHRTARPDRVREDVDRPAGAGEPARSPAPGGVPQGLLRADQHPDQGEAGAGQGARAGPPVQGGSSRARSVASTTPTSRGRRGGRRPAAAAPSPPASASPKTRSPPRRSSCANGSGPSATRTSRPAADCHDQALGANGCTAGPHGRNSPLGSHHVTGISDAMMAIRWGCQVTFSGGTARRSSGRRARRVRKATSDWRRTRWAPGQWWRP